MFMVCHTEEAELLPPQLLPRCPVKDTILIWFLILFPMLSDTHPAAMSSGIGGSPEHAASGEARRTATMVIKSDQYDQ
jgi:hypothetical protein